MYHFYIMYIFIFSLSLLLSSCEASGGLLQKLARRLEVADLTRNKDCANAEYALSWYTIGHIFLIATPSNPPDEQCKSSYVFQDTQNGKEIWPLVEAPKEVANFEQDSLNLGTFNLEDIVLAFNSAKAGTGSYTLDDYDIVTSNCATFIMNMCSELGVTVDENIMTYTARRLATSNGGMIVGLLRKSPNLGLLEIENPEQVKDEILLDSLVRRYVKVYYQKMKASKERSRLLQVIPVADDQLEKCANEIYSVSLGIGSNHICIFAMPVNEANDLGCESIRFHLLDPLKKSIDKRTLANFKEGALFPLKELPLSELMDSYNDFAPSTSNNGTYDFITQNTAPIIVAMLCSLDVDIDEDMLNFITKRFIFDKDIALAEINESSNKDMLGMVTIRENDHYYGEEDDIIKIRKLILYNNQTLTTSLCTPTGATSLAATPSSKSTTMSNTEWMVAFSLVTAAMII